MLALALAGCATILGLETIHDGVCDPGTTQPCPYKGPAKTEGVGVCKAGAQTCAADGQSWSACEGEVDPEHEVCGDGLDNDCDGVVDNGCPCTPGKMSACYDGPAGTDDAGACHAGMHVCKADAKTFGPCTGQQLPAAETCQSTADTNCDGFLCGQSEWVKEFGPASNAGYGGVGVDGAGNVYVTGSFVGPMKIGGTTLVGFGGTNIFVAKFDPKGNLLWADQFGDTTQQIAQGMAVDAQGNVVLTGSTTGPVDFGGGPVDGLIYVVKLDPSGKHVWSTSCGGSQPAMTYGVGGVDVKLDASGNVVLVGTFSGTVNCGDAPHTSAGGLDILLAKLSSGGQATWSSTFGDSSDQYISSVAVDSGGNIAIVGRATGVLDFGGMQLLNGGFYLARFSPSGSHVSSREWSTPLAAIATKVALDSAGNEVVLGGYTSTTLNFGGGVLPAPASGSSGTFLVKFDDQGSYLWGKGFVPPSGQSTGGDTLVLDAADSAFFTGHFSGSFDLGGSTLMTGGAFESIFMARFDSGGAYVWSRAFSGTSSNAEASALGAALGPMGEAAVYGQFEDTFDFGTGPIAQPDMGGSDFFVVKLAPP
jgi:hypothetical protein